MPTAICYCKKCGKKIGNLINLWTHIPIYCSPITESDGDLKVICHGRIRYGERRTLLAECKLQDIACVSCAADLGKKCIESPVNHVIAKNQILFRLASLTLSDDAGKQVQFLVKRGLDVNERFRALNTLENRADLFEDYLDKLESTVGECLREVKGTRDDLASIKNEVGDLKKDVQQRQTTSVDQQPDSISAELSQTRDEVTKLTNQVQQELTDLRAQVSNIPNQVNILTSQANNSVSAANDAHEVASVRAENAELRRLLSHTRSINNQERSFPSRELDILTSNIAKISNRAAQVEGLQMEFEILKGKMERLEADRQTAEIFMSPDCRKRTSSEAGLPETDLAAKLPVVSARSSLSAHIHQLSTHRQIVSLEAAGPEGALPERGQGPQPSLSEGPSKEREPGRGERN